RGALVPRVDDVDAARAEAGRPEEAPLLAGVAVARAAGVPAGVVELVADVGHLEAVDHLRVGRRGRVHVDGGEIVGSLGARRDPDGHRVDDPLARALHRVARRGVAGAAGVAELAARHVVIVMSHRSAPSWEVRATRVALGAGASAGPPAASWDDARSSAWPPS